jgi:hypothetical protein
MEIMTSEQIQKLRELAQGVSEAIPSITLSRWYHRVLKALPELLDEAEAAERLRQACKLCREEDALVRAEFEAENKELTTKLEQAQDVIDTHSELIDYLADLLAEIAGDPIFEGQHVDYVEVQVSRKLWEEAKKFKSITKDLKKGDL